MRGLDDSVLRGGDCGGAEMSPIGPFGHGGNVKTAEKVLDALKQALLVRVDDAAEDLLVHVRCEQKMCRLTEAILS